MPHKISSIAISYSTTQGSQISRKIFEVAPALIHYFIVLSLVCLKVLMIDMVTKVLEKGSISISDIYFGWLINVVTSSMSLA